MWEFLDTLATTGWQQHIPDFDSRSKSRIYSEDWERWKDVAVAKPRRFSAALSSTEAWPVMWWAHHTRPIDNGAAAARCSLSNHCSFSMAPRRSFAGRHAASAPHRLPSLGRPRPQILPFFDAKCERHGGWLVGRAGPLYPVDNGVVGGAMLYSTARRKQDLAKI